MNSEKSFIAALFLVVALSSMSLRVEGRHILQTTRLPQPPMPSIPIPKMSPLPSIPKLPQPPMPTIPIPKMPTFPFLKLPPLPCPLFPKVPTNDPSFFSSPPSTSSSP
ncbi:hypothetical protein Fmac_020438 [Flemingia macrophylla]|uniref:Uncharacterized protein n=1 Tax=Flemingia macrophylla TaxID=520843 RepID=A0ABD1LU00_9FABA